MQAAPYLTTGAIEDVINKAIMCKLAYEQNNRKGLSGFDDEPCLLDRCLAQFLDDKHEPPVRRPRRCP